MRVTPRGVFLALSAIAGTAFAVLTPPLQAPDERRHLNRAFAIAEGVWLAEATRTGYVLRVPRSLTQMERRLSPGLAHHAERRQDTQRMRIEWSQPLAPDDRVHVKPISFYSPLAYLPQAAAIGLARGLDAPPVLYVYLGRFANLAAWIALVALALSRAPSHRLTLCALALAPISVFVAASLSADAATNALSLLLVALLLEAMHRGAPRRRRHAVSLAAVAAGLALTKPVYALLSLGVLLIPRERFESGREQALFVSAVLAAAVLPLAAWSGYAAPVALATPLPGADPAAQLAFVASHPVEYAGVLIATWSGLAGGIVETFVGRLGHLDVRLPIAFVALYAAGLLGLAFWDGGPTSPVRGAARAGLAAIAIGGAVAVYTSGYLGWNDVAAPLVEGVQGRYLWPFAPCLLLAIHGNTAPTREAAVTRTAAVLLAVVLGVAITSLIARYYGPAQDSAGASWAQAFCNT